MDQPLNDPWLNTLTLAIFFASVIAWVQLITRWRRRGTLLEYQPRTPVPWGAPVALLAVLFVAIALLSAAVKVDVPAELQPPLSSFESAQRLMGMIFFQSLLIGGVMTFVAVYHRATLADFGLPTYAHQLANDVKIGIVACLAALAPVYAVQVIMLKLLGPSKHPLVKMVTGGEPDFVLLLLATIAAAVVAPISEEILFRLLLQGWLEKMEDRRVRIDPDGAPDEWTIQAWNINIEDSTEPLVSVRPADRGFAGLPFGWAPIFISSLLFAAAHYGYGPDPIPIFFLAIILGYVYQRTHRIVPCIVAHAMFNSLAMLILWRVIFLQSKLASPSAKYNV